MITSTSTVKFNSYSLSSHHVGHHSQVSACIITRSSQRFGPMLSQLPGVLDGDARRGLTRGDSPEGVIGGERFK